MSGEASTSTKGELEVEQLTDRLKGTSLDGKELAALIREAEAGAKVGNDDGLDNAIASVKAALQNKSVSLSTLMECEELVSVLISGLETDSSKVQLDVLFIVALAFKQDPSCQDRSYMSWDPQQKMVIGSGIIPALISLLPSEDDVICEKALQTLRSISANYDSLDHFRNSDIIPALIELGERTKKTKWFKDMAWIVGHFCMRRGINWDETAGKVGKAEPWMLPSLPVIEELLQLLLILMRGSTSSDEDAWIITELALSSIAQVEGSFEVILASGIVPLVAGALGSSEDPTAALTLAAIVDAVKSDEEILQFFQALQGSSGMKELWRSIFKMNDTSNDDEKNSSKKKKCRAQLDRFLNKVRSALERELRHVMIEAMIQSGFVHSLVKFLEKEAPFEPQGIAMCMLEAMMRETREMNVELFLEMGVVPLLLEQLKSRSDRAKMLAPVCLRHLMKAKDTVREEIVSRGGLQIMIRMLKKERKSCTMVGCLLICLKQIFRQGPKLPLEQFDGLAEALKLENGGEIATRMFGCLKGITDYETSGIDLMRTSGIFGVLIGGLSSELLGVQLFAMEMVMHAALLKQENREALFRLGVLDKFSALLRNPFDKIIQLALICLKVFLNGKLSAGQTKTILGMKSLVDAELLRDRQNTSRAASLLLARMGEIEK